MTKHQPPEEWAEPLLDLYRPVTFGGNDNNKSIAPPQDESVTTSVVPVQEKPQTSLLTGLMDGLRERHRASRASRRLRLEPASITHEQLSGPGPDSVSEMLLFFRAHPSGATVHHMMGPLD